MKNTAGEILYKEMLEGKGYIVKGFDSKRVGKSPDFQVFDNEHLIFYCEVKDIENSQNIEKDKDCKVVDEVSIILNKIYEANKQLISVNSGHKTPNVLAFCCNKFGMDANDLHDAVLGYVEYDNNEKVYRRIRKDVDKRLESKIMIDAFIFYNAAIEQFSAIYINDNGFYGDEISKLDLLQFKNKWE